MISKKCTKNEMQSVNNILEDMDEEMILTMDSSDVLDIDKLQMLEKLE